MPAQDFFPLCLQMEAGTAELIDWLFACLFSWIFYFYLYFMVVLPKINFSYLDYFSLNFMIDKLRKECENCIIF